MFCFIVLLLALQPMVPAQSAPLYTNFVLNDLTLTEQYESLKYLFNTSVKPIVFDAFDPSIDYSSDTWWDPCYNHFYANNAKFLIFWINGTKMYCEGQRQQLRGTNQRFPMTMLMRVERPGKRC